MVRTRLRLVSSTTVLHALACNYGAEPVSTMHGMVPGHDEADRLLHGKLDPYSRSLDTVPTVTATKRYVIALHQTRQTRRTRATRLLSSLTSLNRSHQG